MTGRNQKNQNNLNLFLNNYFNALLAGALILFLAVAYLVFIGPKFRATQTAIQANLEEQQRLLSDNQKKLANLKSLIELYKKINPADLQKFNNVLPDSYVPERLFGELEEIIGRGGWLVSNIRISRPEETAEIKNPGQLSLELSLGGIDYSGLKNFLRLMENNSRLFDITAVSFSSSGNSARIVLTTYYYKVAK